MYSYILMGMKRPQSPPPQGKTSHFVGKTSHFDGKKIQNLATQTPNPITFYDQIDQIPATPFSKHL